MKLLGGFGNINFGNLDTGEWLRGLISAFIVGGSSAVTSGIVVSLKDPQHYSPGTADFFQLVGAVFLMSGLMGAMAFLRTKPLPDVKRVETSVQTTEIPGKPTATVTTVKETAVVPVVAPPKVDEAK